MWLAVGAVVVLGVVALFMLAGGSGGTAEKEKATEAFRELVKAALTDQTHLGVQLVNNRESIVAFNPDLYRRWDSMTKEEREKVLLQLFQWHQQQLKLSLEAKTVADVDKLIESGRVLWVPNPGWVEIRWDRQPPMSSVQHWVVRVQEIDGIWVVTKFEQQE
jgi:hypothetical protein